jgi:hypothetical protein
VTDGDVNTLTVGITGICGAQITVRTVDSVTCQADPGMARRVQGTGISVIAGDAVVVNRKTAIDGIAGPEGTLSGFRALEHCLPRLTGSAETGIPERADVSVITGSLGIRENAVAGGSIAVVDGAGMGGSRAHLGPSSAQAFEAVVVLSAGVVIVTGEGIVCAPVEPVHQHQAGQTGEFGVDSEIVIAFPVDVALIRRTVHRREVCRQFAPSFAGHLDLATAPVDVIPIGVTQAGVLPVDAILS